MKNYIVLGEKVVNGQVKDYYYRVSAPTKGDAMLIVGNTYPDARIVSVKYDYTL